ncbi:MAG: ATP-binding protein [Mycoplasmataceae bacterium]|nr:ATP-binding protein [Mycoplasmataceae bacterium]
MDIELIKKEILSNKKIKKIIDDNNLNDKQIEDSMSIFLDIIEDENDNNLTYTSEISLQSNGVVSRKLVPTQKGLELENKNNFVLRGITIMDYSILPSINNKGKIQKKEFMWNEDRKQLLDYFRNEILSKFKKGEYFKGIYLHGDFGVGKSFFNQSLANYFASQGKSVAYINNNDLANHLKNLFTTGYKKTIDTLKNVDFLFIDDIGSEKNSAWMISEIMFSILSHRMQVLKTTFFTSNFSYKQLEKEFAKGVEVSGFKARRLMERIEVLSVPIFLKGNNWRKL